MQRPLPELDVTHLRGRIAGLIRASAFATFTEDQRARFIGSLPEVLRGFASQAPDPDGWVSTQVLAEFLAEVRKVSPVRTARSRAQLQADVLMEGAPELKGASPREVVARLPWFYAQAHQGGRVSLIAVDDHHGRVLLQARYPYADWYTDVLPAWIQRALERAGGKEVRVVHHPPGEEEEAWVHRYEMAWTS